MLRKDSRRFLRSGSQSQLNPRHRPSTQRRRQRRHTQQQQRQRTRGLAERRAGHRAASRTQRLRQRARAEPAHSDARAAGGALSSSSALRASSPSCFSGAAPSTKRSSREPAEEVRPVARTPVVITNNANRSQLSANDGCHGPRGGNRGGERDRSERFALTSLSVGVSRSQNGLSFRFPLRIPAGGSGGHQWWSPQQCPALCPDITVTACSASCRGTATAMVGRCRVVSMTTP